MLVGGVDLVDAPDIAVQPAAEEPPEEGAAEGARQPRQEHAAPETTKGSNNEVEKIVQEPERTVRCHCDLEQSPDNGAAFIDLCHLGPRR